MLQTAAMLAMAETGMPPVSKNIYVNDKKCRGFNNKKCKSCEFFNNSSYRCGNPKRNACSDYVKRK